MPWTANPQHAQANRRRWIERHWVGTPAGGHSGHLTDPEKHAGWVSNEVMPMLEDLQAQGYSLENREDVAELLEQQGESSMARFVLDQEDPTWMEFLDFGKFGKKAMYEGPPHMEHLEPRIREVLTGEMDSDSVQRVVTMLAQDQNVDQGGVFGLLRAVERGQLEAQKFVDQVRAQADYRHEDLKRESKLAGTRANMVRGHAETYGLNVASTWSGDDGIEGRLEFNEQPDTVARFAGEMQRTFTDCKFTIDHSRYNVPTLWITTK